MDQLKRKIIAKINELTDERLLREIEQLLHDKKEMQELEAFVVESRIDEIEDDEFVNREEAERLAANSLKTKRGPRL